MRSLVLACSCLLACSEVTIVPNDGGGSSDDGLGGDAGVGAAAPGVGGSGGAPAPEPRTIELALAGPLDGDLAGVGVLVNRSDGSLRASYSGLDLPIVTEVEDGDMVSFAVPDDEPETRLQSYRVRPGVERIEVFGPTSGLGCEELEPMTVTLDIPTVAGAEQYRIHTRDDTFQVEPGQQTIQLRACTTNDAEPVLVVASAGSAPPTPLAFDFLEVTYEPGGSALLTTSLVMDRQEVALITNGNAADVNGWWIPDERPFPWADGDLGWQPIPGGYGKSFIAPGGGYAWINVFGVPGVTSDGWCKSSHQQLHIASSPDPLTVDVSTFDLAQPRLLADGSVAFADDGLRGDYLYRAYTNDIEVYYWSVYDDPASEWLPVVFPELPAGDPWQLDPGEPLAPYGDVVHEDLDSAQGYADFVATQPPAYSARHTRRVGPCD